MIHQTAPVIFTRSFDDNPWEHISFMRSQGPISPVQLPAGIPAWFITDHELAKHVLSDSRFGRDSRELEAIFQSHNTSTMLGLPLDDEKSLEANMLNRDDEDHKRLRKLSMKAFTPSTVAKLTDRITAITCSLITVLPENECFDISAALGYPLPMTMICEILGIAEGDGRKDFQKLSKILLRRREEQKTDELIAAQEALYDKLTEIIDNKRVTLQNKSPEDLLDELILAHDEGDRLSNQELITMAILLLIAGHETTVALITNCIMRLALDNDLMQKLKSDPTKIPAFVEEVLRLDPPAQYTSIRFAKEDFFLQDFSFKKDELYVVSVLAANYDPKIYDQPAEISLEQANNHLAFGHGAHFCLGAALARKEAIICLTQIIEKYSRINFVPPADNPQWRPGKYIGSHDKVPVTLHR